MGLRKRIYLNEVASDEAVLREQRRLERLGNKLYSWLRENAGKDVEWKRPTVGVGSTIQFKGQDRVAVLRMSARDYSGASGKKYAFWELAIWSPPEGDQVSLSIRSPLGRRWEDTKRPKKDLRSIEKLFTRVTLPKKK